MLGWVQSLFGAYDLALPCFPIWNIYKESYILTSYPKPSLAALKKVKDLSYFPKAMISTKQP